MDNLESFMRELEAELRKRFPFVNLKYSTLGGESTVSILIAVSMEPKEVWMNGYIENSPYSRIQVERDGETSQFSGYKFKLRKFYGKSAKDIGEKINERLVPSGR